MSDQMQVRVFVNGVPTKARLVRQFVTHRAPRFKWLPRWFWRFSFYWREWRGEEVFVELEQVPPKGADVLVEKYIEFPLPVTELIEKVVKG